MDNVFNEDILITAVQSKPVLWDPSDDLYSKKVAKRDAWKDVCNEVISGFDDLPVSKQREYNDQVRSRWHCIRTAYRLALIKRQPFPRGPQLSFLNKLFTDIADQTPLNGGNLPNTDDKNDEEMQREHPHNHRKEEYANANNSTGLPEIVFLDPVLSINKIDNQICNDNRVKVGRPRKRKSPNSQDEVVPSITKSIIHQETSMRSIDDSNDEHNDQNSTTKRHRYRYEVQMASTRRNAARGQTSAYATVSFDDDRPLAEYTKVTHPHGYDAYNDGPASETGSSPPPPPTSRRQESYYNSQYPMIPALPVDYNDGDMAFFRSLLTWTRRFTEQETLEFRMEVMKLITRMHSYESLGNYYVISQTPLS